MYARITAFAVWALLAASVVFWLLKLTVNPLPAPVDAVAALDGAPSRADLSRLLGSTPVGAVIEAAVAIESRFRLIGVVAPKTGMKTPEGVALISVDGKPAKPYRVGAAVDADLQLLSLSSRSAALGVVGGAESSNVVLQLTPPSAAVNQPIVKPGGMVSAGGQQEGVAAMLAPGSQLAPVPITPGMNPVKEDDEDASGNAPASQRRGAVPHGNVTR